MTQYIWIDELDRAVKNGNTERLTEIVDALNAAESAKDILRKKGYGHHGMTIDATARLVPDLT